MPRGIGSLQLVGCHGEISQHEVEKEEEEEEERIVVRKMIKRQQKNHLKKLKYDKKKSLYMSIHI